MSGTGWPALPVLHHWIPTTINYREGYQMIKFCNKCKSDTDRYKNGQCKPCKKEKDAIYYEKNKEIIRAKQAEYYVENNEQIKEQKKNSESAKAWRKYNWERNKEILKTRTNEWRFRNRGKLCAYTKNWLSEHPEYSSQYRKSHLEKIRIHKQNRRAKERINGGKLSSDIVDKLMKLQKGKCVVCRKTLNGDYHLDHITPIALGGENRDSNIQLLHSTCNKKKGKKHPVIFMNENGFLL